MFALLWMLDARAERIVLEASGDTLRIGENVSTNADWNGDRVGDIVATGSREFAVWTVDSASVTLGPATTFRSDIVRGSAISVVSGLARVGGADTDGVVLRGPNGSIGAYGAFAGPSWPSSVIATALGLYTDAWLDDTFVSDSSYRHVLGIPDTGRGVTGEVKVLDGALVTIEHCLSAVVGFGQWARLTSKATGDGVGWLLVATVQASSTTVAWWRADTLPTERPCSAVWYQNVGELTSFEVPSVATQYALTTGSAARGAWMALGDADGAVHVHAFPPGTLEGGATTHPLSDLYPMGTSGFPNSVRLIAADVVGDDTPDLVVANPDIAPSGAVWAWEGTTQADGRVAFGPNPWKTWTGLASGDAFGTSVGALEDLDGDGKRELVVGATGAAAGRGQVHVLLSRTDTDGDGVFDPEDCAPEDATRHEGAAWYRDADGDGQGDPSATVPYDCAGMPADTVPNAMDCDDGDPNAYDGATVWADDDGDGQGDGASEARDATFTLTCPWTGAPYATNALDCDDTRDDVYQGGTEVCDRADNDCNGLNDDGVSGLIYADSDGDGFGAGEGTQGCLSEGTADNDGDCDDTRADVNPDAEDLPSDGLDQDCDDAEVLVTWGRGACGCGASPATGASFWLAAAAFAGMALRGRRAHR